MTLKPLGLSDEQVQDIIASLVASDANVNWTYDDTNDELTASLDNSVSVSSLEASDSFTDPAGNIYTGRVGLDPSKIGELRGQILELNRDNDKLRFDLGLSQLGFDDGQFNTYVDNSKVATTDQLATTFGAGDTGRVKIDTIFNEDSTQANGTNLSYSFSPLIPIEQSIIKFTGTGNTTDPAITISSDADTQTINYSGTISDGNTVDVSEQFNANKLDDGLISLESVVDSKSSTSYNIDGNISDTELFLTGKIKTQSNNYSGSFSSSTFTEFISIGGNKQPTDGNGNDPELSITGSGATEYYNPITDQGDSSYDSDYDFIGDDYTDTQANTEVEVKPNASGVIERLTFAIGENDLESSYPVDVYIEQGQRDGTVGNGTYLGRWDVGTASETNSDFTPDNDFTVQSGNIYTLEFESQGGIDFGSTNMASLEVDYSGSPSLEMTYLYQGNIETTTAYADIEMKIVNNPSSVSVTDDTDASVSFGSFTDGETKTQQIDLSTSSTQLDFSVTGGESIDYQLTLEERTVTENPSLDINSPDGTQTVDYTGTIQEGTTVDITSQLDNSVIGGDGTLTLSPTVSELSSPEGMVGIEFRVPPSSLVSAPNRNVTVDVSVSGDVGIELIGGPDTASVTHQTKDLGFVPVDVTLNDDVVGDDSAVSYTIEDGNGNTVTVNRSDVDTIVDCSNFTSSTITVTVSISDLQTDLLEWGAYFQ